MTATKPERPVVVTDDDNEPTAQEELAAKIGYLNDNAKRLSRRGQVGTRSADYAREHKRINDTLTDFFNLPPCGSS